MKSGDTGSLPEQKTKNAVKSTGWSFNEISKIFY